ncbi:DUF2304 family protein [Candidatus Uhrbacteria bacterium]|nr:DUF2304 family protein [Candidatus Uhrbacteria bacterium]
MSLIQIFILLFALFAISRTLRQFRQGALSIAWLIFWIVFWIVVGGVAISPQTTDVIAKLVGVGRGADFVIYISLIALFYLIFRLFGKIEDVEREITKLVRKLAVEEEDKGGQMRTKEDNL